MKPIIINIFVVLLLIGFSFTVSINAEYDNKKKELLTDDFNILLESPSPEDIHVGAGGINVLESGRIVANAGGNIFTSDDGGESWDKRLRTQGSNIARLRFFEANDYLYAIGNANNGPVRIMRSHNDGEVWGGLHTIDSRTWHSATTNVWKTDTRVFVAMELMTDPDFPYWHPSTLSPMLLSAPLDANLLDKDVWTVSDKLIFKEDVPEPVGIGVPFFDVGSTLPYKPQENEDRRFMHPAGWLEANVIQIHDPNHFWFDPEGRTFHLFMRAHTGRTNYAAIAEAKISEDGQDIEMNLVEAPSGEPMVFIPMPGGHMKFDIIYDEQTKLYWLIATESTDSMTVPHRLSDERYGLPDNERHRLALYYSKNAVDWIKAGLVDVGDSYGQARHYANIAIDGEDLLILSRSGDERADSAHNCNLVTFHRIEQFRSLVDPFIKKELNKKNEFESVGNLIKNSRIENDNKVDLNYWESFNPAEGDKIKFTLDNKISYIEDTSSLSIEVPEGSELAWPRWRQTFEISEDIELLYLSSFAKSSNVTGPGGVYVEIIYYNEEDKRIKKYKSPKTLSGDNTWEELSIKASSVPPETDYVNITLILQGEGKVWFDDIKVIGMKK